MALRHSAWSNKSCYNIISLTKKICQAYIKSNFLVWFIHVYIYIYTCETPIKVYGQVPYLAKLEKFSSYSLSSSAVINM